MVELTLGDECGLVHCHLLLPPLEEWLFLLVPGSGLLCHELSCLDVHVSLHVVLKRYKLFCLDQVLVQLDITILLLVLLVLSVLLPLLVSFLLGLLLLVVLAGPLFSILVDCLHKWRYLMVLACLGLFRPLSLETGENQVCL